MGHTAEQMEAIRMARIDGEDLPAQLLGLGGAAGLLAAQRLDKEPRDMGASVMRRAACLVLIA
jgi:hypothetical protein